VSIAQFLSTPYYNRPNDFTTNCCVNANCYSRYEPFFCSVKKKKIQGEKLNNDCYVIGEKINDTGARVSIKVNTIRDPSQFFQRLSRYDAPCELSTTVSDYDLLMFVHTSPLFPHHGGTCGGLHCYNRMTA